LTKNIFQNDCITVILPEHIKYELMRYILDSHSDNYEFGVLWNMTPCSAVAS